MTRGERNNNPGNIDYNPNIPYKGMLGLEVVPDGEDYRPRFARFDTAVNGLRAVGVCLLAYYHRHGLNTVQGLVSRWAPSNENNTKAYAEDVATHLGVSPTAVIDVASPQILQLLIQNFVRHENGKCAYTLDDLEEAAKSALGE